VDEWEAEYLLIAENTERRGEAETDPIKKARIAQFLKEYWGIRDFGNNKKFDGQNVQQKTMQDVGNAIGESHKQTQRLIKLNDLIPELQQLVSEGKLGTTAGEQLAYLTEEAQRELWDKLGEGIGDKTVKEVSELRRQIEDKDNIIDELKSELQAKGADKPLEPQIIEKEVIVEKLVYQEVVPEDVKQQLQEMEKRAKKAEKDLKAREASIDTLIAENNNLKQLEDMLKQRDSSPLKDMYVMLRSVNDRARVILHEIDRRDELVNATPAEVVNDIISQLQVLVGYKETLITVLEGKSIDITVNDYAIKNTNLLEGEIIND